MMELDIRKILNLTGSPDVQTANAIFFRHVPRVAPYAYLHTIFLPPSPDLLNNTARALSLPDIWSDWLKIQNGADVFSGALVFYGIVPFGQLMSRSSKFAQAPFSIEDVNQELPLRKYPQCVQIGTYSSNRARLLLNGSDNTMLLVDEPAKQVLCEWPDAGSFLSEELSRLAMLFDRTGKLLVADSLTVPRRATQV